MKLELAGEVEVEGEVEVKGEVVVEMEVDVYVDELDNGLISEEFDPYSSNKEYIKLASSIEDGSIFKVVMFDTFILSIDLCFNQIFLSF